MTHLRLVVLGCLMLVAFAQGTPGDVLSGCLFTPNCLIDDVRGLARDLKLVATWKNGALGALIDCIDVIAATRRRAPYPSTGCFDDFIVKKSGCDVACDVVKKLLPVKK